MVARRRLPTLRRGAVPRIARRAAAPCTAAAAGDAAPGEGAALQPERQDLKTTLGGALSGFNKALFGGADASSASSSAAQKADPPAPPSTAQAPGSPAEGAAAVSASANTGEGADATGTASPAAEAGAGGAPTDPIESWDRPNAESDWEPAGFGGAPPQPPRRPSRLGEALLCRLSLPASMREPCCRLACPIALALGGGKQIAPHARLALPPRQLHFWLGGGAGGAGGWCAVQQGGRVQGCRCGNFLGPPASCLPADSVSAHGTHMCELPVAAPWLCPQGLKCALTAAGCRPPAPGACSDSRCGRQHHRSAER